MKTQDKLNALLAIKREVENWSAHQPEWHYRLHGSKDINIALQLVKKLIACETQRIVEEEQEELKAFLQGSPDSLGINNIE